MATSREKRLATTFNLNGLPQIGVRPIGQEAAHDAAAGGAFGCIVEQRAGQDQAGFLQHRQAQRDAGLRPAGGQRSQATVTYGRTGEGDGITRQGTLFHTLPLAGDGFINLTAEWRDRGATNRAGPDASDGGRINTHFGDADTQDGLFALNAELPRGDATLYLHGLYDRRRSSAGAFYRTAGDARNITAIYPDGFLPRIEPKILDFSATAGVRGVLDGGARWDISYTHGHNDYHFYVNNSLNTSLGLATPTSFDSGATRYTQQILNADFSKKIGRHTVAGGYEFRQEHYRIIKGDAASYMLGSADNFAYGAQGFPGFSPENAVSASRQAHSLYGDLKYSATERLMQEHARRHQLPEVKGNEGVRSVAQGLVKFAGRQNGYGNVVEIDHGNGKSTLYAHLSRIDVRTGQRVDQGARVGAVGATGWATGPHLHFEFKVQGAQVNPVAMAKSSEAIELSPASRQRFAGIAQQIRGQLDAALTVGATVAE